jgi:hypothetical protein
MKAIDRFTPRQIERALALLGDDAVKELRTQLQKKPTTELQKRLLADVVEHGARPEKISAERLRELAAKELFEVQRAVQGPAMKARSEALDVDVIGKTYGAWAAQLFLALDNARASERVDAEVAPLERLSQKAARQEALESFLSYYPAAGVLPTVPEGKTVLTFDNAQVRWFHRMYWSAPPGMRLPELMKLAKKADEF